MCANREGELGTSLNFLREIQVKFSNVKQSIFIYRSRLAKDGIEQKLVGEGRAGRRLEAEEWWCWLCIQGEEERVGVHILSKQITNFFSKSSQRSKRKMMRATVLNLDWELGEIEGK